MKGIAYTHKYIFKTIHLCSALRIHDVRSFTFAETKSDFLVHCAPRTATKGRDSFGGRIPAFVISAGAFRRKW